MQSNDVGDSFDLNTRPGPAGASFFFSVAVPERSYRVTAVPGDPAVACVTTIQGRDVHRERAEFLLPAPALNAPGGDRVMGDPLEPGIVIPLFDGLGSVSY